MAIGLGHDLTWIAANEKSILGEFLVSVGQRTASERVAFLLLNLFQRARTAGLVSDNAVELPITQHDVADTIGFSLVHTNKTIGRLKRSGTFNWTGQLLTVLDEERLAELANRPSGPTGPRPFI